MPNQGNLPEYLTYRGATYRRQPSPPQLVRYNGHVYKLATVEVEAAAVHTALEALPPAARNIKALLNSLPVEAAFLTLASGVEALRGRLSQATESMQATAAIPAQLATRKIGEVSDALLLAHGMYAGHVPGGPVDIEGFLKDAERRLKDAAELVRDL